MSQPHSTRQGGPPRWRLLISVVGTLVLMGLVLFWAGVGGIADALASLSPRVLLLAFGLQVMVSLLAAWRVQLLLGGAVRFRASLAISLVHTAFLMFAPMRSGELVYVYLVRRVTGREAARGLSQVVIFRMFDILALAVITLGLLGWVGQSLLTGDSRSVALMAVATLLLVLLTTSALVFRGGDLLHRVGERMSGRGRLGDRLAGWARAAALEMGIGAGGAALQMAASLAIWVLVLISAWVVIAAAGVPLPAPQVGAILALQRFVLAIPIPALGTFGPNEASFTAMAVPLGVSQVQHSLVAIYALLMGVVAGGWLSWRA